MEYIKKTKSIIRKLKKEFEENDTLSENEKAEIILENLLEAGMEMDLTDIIKLERKLQFEKRREKNEKTSKNE